MKFFIRSFGHTYILMGFNFNEVFYQRIHNYGHTQLYSKHNYILMGFLWKIFGY